MSAHQSVSRYAEAFLDSLLVDLDHFQKGWDTSEELRTFLSAPDNSLDEKKELMRQVFSDLLDPFTLNLLHLLLEQGRLELAGQISELATAQLHRWRDMLAVQITTAIPLPQAEEQTLVKTLQERYGKEVLLEKIVDPNLLGGAVLRIGDKLFDGSVKHQLDALKIDLLK